MTFEQHMQEANKRLEERDSERRAVREAGQVLLSLRYQEQIRNLIREISKHGGERDLE